MKIRRQKKLMEKKNPEDGEELPPKLNQKTFELRCSPSVGAHSSQYQLLALTRYCFESYNGRANKNMLLLRMKKPLHHFNGFSDNNTNKEDYNLDRLSSVNLPIVEQLPRSITWVYTDSNKLMAKIDSVIGKRQMYYVGGEAMELSSISEGDEEQEEEEEATVREKHKFSEDEDRFIWNIGQERGLEDLVVKNALSKFLELELSDILERYNELKLKYVRSLRDASDLITPQIMISLFQVTADVFFCRRCLVFNCSGHGNSLPVIYAREKKKSVSFESKKKCSRKCYLKKVSLSKRKKKNHIVLATIPETEECVMIGTNEITKDITKMSLTSQWTTVEKDLYLIGVEIFGKNSCSITRNLLVGFKTCLEVYNYMREQDHCAMLLQHNNASQKDNKVNKEVSRKMTKWARRKASKYAHYPLALKKTVHGETKTFKQYTPCNCYPICGAQCTCLANGNCCEKYCGCSKICKNRFRGCSCLKGQCINRQCPCFAASRECDPDLCQSCSFRCGEEDLGKTTEQGQCKNMQFLLKKDKKISIEKSGVHGWGAYLQQPVKKNEYLGEYTGELITHTEANERGRAEFQLGSSYLFTLNDQFEIDARRIGNNFRYLNHSAKPNCYAKLMIVRGDHKIGMYADRDIDVGEELFFDYCYGPGHAPWSLGRTSRTRKTSSSASKKTR